MEVVRIYPARSNDGVERKTKKSVHADRIDTFEEWHIDPNLTLVNTLSNESFIIDEPYDEFKARLANERIIDGGI